MMNKTDWKQRFKEGKEKLKPMTWTQRIDHIWTYYKAVILVALALIIVPVGLVISLAGKKDVRFGGMVVNLDMRKNGTIYLSEDLGAKLGINPRKEVVEISANGFDTLSNEAEGNYNAAMSTVARIDAGTLDYLIMDKASMEFYITQEIYLDLNLIFTPEELAAFGEENLIYVTPDTDETLRIPVAIDISQTVFTKDCLSDTKEIYLAFVGAEDRAGEYREFWDYLLAWEQTDYHKEMSEKTE